MAEHSPTPWRLQIDEVGPEFTDVPIVDANGEPVVITDSGCYPPDNATAALIVEAVNGVEATRKLQRTLLGWSIERDRLRDLVRRMCDELESHYHEPGSMDDPCIVREAREAIGEGEQ